MDKTFETTCVFLRETIMTLY